MTKLTMNSRLTIYEEETNLLWGLVVVIASASATYLLGDAFVDDSFFLLGFRQLFALFLFVLAFIGILKITEPLYRFELKINGQLLVIDAWKGEDHIKTIRYSLPEIEELRFSPKAPSLQDEALFDFSTNYYLTYRHSGEDRYRKLIDLDNVTFTLKVPDIIEIMRLLLKHNKEIGIPQDQRMLL